MATTVKIVQSETEDHVPFEVLASSVAKISDGFERIEKSGLNRRALLVLLADSTGVNKTQINRVLNGLRCLKAEYLTAPKKPKQTEARHERARAGSTGIIHSRADVSTRPQRFGVHRAIVGRNTP